MSIVYLRPLNLDDAKVSYKWRNNPNLWRYTKFRAVNFISYEVEVKWLSECLQRQNERRFAICVKENDEYIGNVQLTDIAGQSGELHIVIGNEAYWNKGIGRQATCLILDYAFNTANLESVRLEVHPDNHSAMLLYQKIGFRLGDLKNGFIHMSISKEVFLAGYSHNARGNAAVLQAQLAIP